MLITPRNFRIKYLNLSFSTIERNYTKSALLKKNILYN
ncbi:hypothetical protein A1OE_923 [Candidatus Endolissoclinum faulkneri L2]|uniref:Uncharacterized protein n=1 Tax=Candidatus Endolissoclinum faulkneri L2 TaxID=1193729 RepID=K7ZD22_9PROT|nr:hypothetical protein A1OE_923 [Candidatus Endolissoclinum faulkneri L2]